MQWDSLSADLSSELIRQLINELHQRGLMVDHSEGFFRKLDAISRDNRKWLHDNNVDCCSSMWTGNPITHTQNDKTRST